MLIRWATVDLRHHPGETHKGDLFTKFLVPIKFERGLELLKMKRSLAGAR